MQQIYIDADACPVKDETYKVAARYGWPVLVVANGWLRLPDDPAVTLVTVAEGADVADDWIAERAGIGDVVITADIPLAERCLLGGARVIGPTGRFFTRETIGETRASRDLMAELRDSGEIRGGGRPFSQQDRSNFLQALDRAIQAIRRTGA
jgi:uncharacterized protein YaiI (UPF0178 family)